MALARSANRDRRADDTEITVDALVTGDPVVAEEVIARVLGRAHRTAEALDAPDEARAILRLAHSFADELAAMDPRFDRARFIRAAVTRPS
jgi:hypothetical protein